MASLSPRSALQHALKSSSVQRQAHRGSYESHATSSHEAARPAGHGPRKGVQAHTQARHVSSSTQCQSSPRAPALAASKRSGVRPPPVDTAHPTEPQDASAAHQQPAEMDLMSPAARALRQLQSCGFTTPGAQAAPPHTPPRAVKPPPGRVSASSRHPPRSSLKSDQDLARLLNAFGEQRTAQDSGPPAAEGGAGGLPARRSLSELREAQVQRGASRSQPPPNTGLQAPLPPPRSSSLSGPKPGRAAAPSAAAEQGQQPSGLLRSAAAHTPQHLRPSRQDETVRLTLPPETHPSRWLALGLQHHAPGLVAAIGLQEASQAVLSALQQGEEDCQGPLVDLLGDGCLDFVAAVVAGRELLLASCAHGSVPPPKPTGGIPARSSRRGGTRVDLSAPADSPAKAHAPRGARGPLTRQVSASSVGSAYSFGRCDESAEFHGDLFQESPAPNSAHSRGGDAASAAAAGRGVSPSRLFDSVDGATARKRASALSELMNSEAGYIARLLRLVEVFLAPSAPERSRPRVPPVEACLKGTALDLVLSERRQLGALKNSDAPQHAAGHHLSEGEHRALFRDVQGLLPLHYTLLQHMVSAAQEAQAVADQSDFLFGAEGDGGAAGSRLDCVTPHTAPFVCIGALVEQCASSFARAYAPYVAGHGRALQLLGDLTGGHARFTEWLRSHEQACGGQTLQSFLIMPVQRIPRYALLLKEVEQATPEHHPEHGMLANALSTAKQAAEDINSAVAEVAEREKVGALQAALSPAPAPSLVCAGARFVKCGWLDKITGGTGLREYLVVLLPTRFVYASVSRPSEALLEHRAAYKEASRRLGDPSTRLKHGEREVLQHMRAAYRAAEECGEGGQAPGEGGSEAQLHAQQVWAAALDPSSNGIMPNTPPPLEGVALSLHNAIALRGARARTVQGRPALRIEGEPKCITLVFDSTAERDEWAYACRAMLQKAQQLAEAATLGEGGYASVWAGAS